MTTVDEGLPKQSIFDPWSAMEQSRDCINTQFDLIIKTEPEIEKPKPEEIKTKRDAVNKILLDDDPVITTTAVNRQQNLAPCQSFSGRANTAFLYKISMGSSRTCINKQKCIFF